MLFISSFPIICDSTLGESLSAIKRIMGLEHNNAPRHKNGGGLEYGDVGFGVSGLTRIRFGYVNSAMQTISKVVTAKHRSPRYSS